MEVEELKAGWNVLNERLAQNEILNKRIIKDMITTRTQSAYERLFKFDLFGIILLIALCILLPFIDVAFKAGTKTISFVLLEGLMIVGLFMQCFIFSLLAKFNMDKMNIRELSRLTLKYKLWTRRNYTWGTVLAIIVLIAFYFIQQAYLISDAPLRLAVALLFTFVIIYYSICFYKKNIRIIEKGLEELKEFEEEEAILE